LIKEKVGIFYENKPKYSKLAILVIRINKMGETCNARPCYNCLNMMKTVGIHKVYYSVAPSKVVCENVKDMISIQASSVCKYIEKMNGNIYSDNPEKYYEYLLIKYFPPIIKKHNLELFINYNLINVLPKYRVEIKINIVFILNTKNDIIVQSKIII
jgi:hypothetical protein